MLLVSTLNAAKVIPIFTTEIIEIESEVVSRAIISFLVNVTSFDFLPPMCEFSLQPLHLIEGSIGLWD